MQSICLNMIVKNEAHIIIKTLENILQNIPITYWVISDTGSTDGTQDIIKQFFKEKKIDGELFEDEWKDFGHNRSLALSHAYNKTDYLFIFDADDSIIGDFTLPKILDKECYFLKFGKTFTYKRILLINNKIKWHFKGVLHEFIQTTDGNNLSEQLIEGNYFIVSGKNGSRNSDPNKYKNDAIILKNAYENEQDLHLKSRYAFYCAQSFKDDKDFLNAINWYKISLNNPWEQERYVSCLEIGNLSHLLGDDLNAINYWIKSSEYDEERIEGVVLACELFYKMGNHIMVNILYERFKNYNKNQSHKLFVNMTKYYDELEFYNSISAFYLKKYQSGYECCKKILINQIASKEKINLTENNIKFYKK